MWLRARRTYLKRIIRVFYARLAVFKCRSGLRGSGSVFRVFKLSLSGKIRSVEKKKHSYLYAEFKQSLATMKLTGLEEQACLVHNKDFIIAPYRPVFVTR